MLITGVLGYAVGDTVVGGQERASLQAEGQSVQNGHERI